jgi:hypothetical protein
MACRGTWARVTIDHFRRVAVQNCTGQRASANTILPRTFGSSVSKLSRISRTRPALYCGRGGVVDRWARCPRAGSAAACSTWKCVARWGCSVCRAANRAWISVSSPVSSPCSSSGSGSGACSDGSGPATAASGGSGSAALAHFFFFFFFFRFFRFFLVPAGCLPSSERSRLSTCVARGGRKIRCRGAWVRVTIDQFRRLALRTFYGHDNTWEPRACHVPWLSLSCCLHGKALAARSSISMCEVSPAIGPRHRTNHILWPVAAFRLRPAHGCTGYRLIPKATTQTAPKCAEVHRYPGLLLKQHRSVLRTTRYPRPLLKQHRSVLRSTRYPRLLLKQARSSGTSSVPSAYSQNSYS